MEQTENKTNINDLMSKKALIMREAYKRKPLMWLSECVKTVDEHDQENPVKGFPMLPYVPFIIEEYQNNQVLFIEKSRQMIATWIFSSLCLHLAQFFPYRRVFFISKKEDDAFTTIDKRMRFIYNHQPMWLKKICELEKPFRDQPMGTITFKNGSIIKGLPQGPDQIRQHTASLIIIDEGAFQERLAETYGACLPSVAGGGKLVVISSANPSEFQRMCEE